MKPSIRHALVFAAALLLASPLALATASAGHAAKVDRLLDAVVQMMPFGPIFDMFAEEDPEWPFSGLTEVVGAGQIACVRSELSSAGYRRYQLPRATAYAGNNAGRLDKDLALLEGGAAPLFGKLVMAGVEGERTGVEVNPNVALAGATPAQIEAFLTLFSEPDYAGLRELAGVGDALDTNKSETENEAAGEKLGGDLASMLIRRALNTCGVDPVLLQ